MRDRLIELMQKVKDVECGDITNYDIEHIADYLLANGVIIPPCKVGDMVYIIENSDMLDIEPSVCSIIEDETYEMSFGKTRSGEFKWLYLVYDSGADFHDTDIGKTVFLTKEEAERALKEREQSGC